MLALFTMLAATSAANVDIRPLLRHQGFYGPINGQETIKYVGHIQQGRKDYQIYLYNGAFRAAAVYHGVNRLIVILNGSIYVGAYDSSDASHCKARGQQVICNTQDTGVIEFTKHGPPREVQFDGMPETITYGNKLKAYWCNEHPCGRLKE